MVENKRTYESVLNLSDEETIDLRSYLFKFLGYWKLFLASISLALVFGFLYIRYTAPKFPVQSTILIQEEKNNMSSMLLDELDFLGTGSNIENEVGILGSYALIGKVVDSLKLSIEQYQLGTIRNVLVYGENAPFIVKTNHTDWNDLIFEVSNINQKGFYIELNRKDTLGFQKRSIGYGESIEYHGFEFKVLPNPVVNIAKYVDIPVQIVFRNRFEKINQLKDNLKIAPINKDATIIQLSTESTTPNLSMDFINLLMEIYIQRELDNKNETAVRSIDFIDDQLVGIESELFAAEDALERFRSEKNIVNISQEGMSVFTRLQELETQLANSEMQLDYYDYLLNYLDKKPESGGVVSPSTAGIQDPSLNSLVVSYNELLSQMTALEGSASAINPQFRTLNQQLKNTLDAIKENVVSLKSGGEIQKNDLQLRVKEVERDLNQLPGNERQLVNIQRKFNLNENLYIYLLEQKAEAGILRASNVPSTKVVDFAITFKKTSPKTLLTYLITFILGLFLPVTYIIIKDYFTTTIQTIAEVERKTSIPILASIAFSKYDTELVLDRHPRSMVSESFRKMRASMKFLVPEENHNTIMFTSFLSGDGKTFSAINTAIMMAKAGRKTVLLGLDLRKPKIFDTFGVNNDKGISNVLINDLSIEEVIHHTKIRNLDFISAGPTPPNPNELLMNQEFRDLMNWAKTNYDSVILDTAPIGLVSDAVEIAKYSDINIFVLRYQKTPKHAIVYANDLFEKSLIPNLGIVINGMDFSKSGYGYGYGYGYSYGYGGYYQD